MRHIDLCGIDVLCKTSNSSHHQHRADPSDLDPGDPDPSAPRTDPLTSDSAVDSTSAEDSDSDSHQSDSRHEEFEPYTTEKLSTIRGGYKLLSDVVPIMHFNFNDPDVS